MPDRRQLPSSFSLFTDRDTDDANSSYSSLKTQLHLQQQSTLYSISVMVLVAVLSTLMTLLFAQTVLTLPLPLNGRYMRYLSNEIARLSHQDTQSDAYSSHAELLDRLQHDFYTSDGITHDVFVKGVHSHNDYWRHRPLLDALSLGVQSVEADIWSFPEQNDNDVYVGHSKRALRQERLLETLYLDELYAILSGANNRNNTDTDPGTAATAAKIADADTDTPHTDTDTDGHQAGVWDTDSDATLYFFIDFKTDGSHLFDALSMRLDRFRQQNWLSWYNTSSGEFHWGPITVVGTGNTPLDRVLGQGERRDIFFDGPLDKLTDADDEIYTLGVSPIASASLKALVGHISAGGALNDEQLAVARRQVARAHSLGIKTRIWDTPWWPVGRKYAVWRQILEAGSDFLNADDLADAVAFRD